MDTDFLVQTEKRPKSDSKILVYTWFRLFKEMTKSDVT